MKKIQVIILSSVLVAGMATAAVAANWDTIKKTGADTRNTEVTAVMPSAAPSTEAVSDSSSTSSNVNKAVSPAKGQNQKNGGTSDTSAALKERKGNGGPLASLVTAGTITQSQADAVMKATQPGSGKTMSDVLASLVSAGTITQAQADSISSLKIGTPPDKGNGGPGQGSGQGPAPQQ